MREISYFFRQMTLVIRIKKHQINDLVHLQKQHNDYATGMVCLKALRLTKTAFSFIKLG